MRQPDRQRPAKKTYRRPQLTAYGTVRQLTRTSSGGPIRDGGTVPSRNRSH